MDIMDIQAVESKLSDVTVTPIPRSQVQNFYNYQQREQREQQPQIQISAIRNTGSTSSSTLSEIRERDIFTKREREFLQQSSSANVAAALQYSQLQAQLALLQQQANTTASLSSVSSSGRESVSLTRPNSNNNSVLNVQANNNSAVQSQLKYPQSTSPLMIVTTQTSANITTPMTSTANLPMASSSNGLSKYAQLLAIIEEMGRDIRPTYTGSRSSTERLKRGIVTARILVRECLMETERSARQ